MNRLKRSMLICVLAIVLTTLLSAGVVQAAGLSGATWRVVKSPNPGSSGNFLNGVAAISAKNIWAVGGYGNGSTFQTLIEHWNGTSWQVVASPNVGSGSNLLRSVATVSAKNNWAVGYYQTGNTSQTLIEHWNGSNWQVVASPNVGSGSNELYGVARVPSGTHLRAVGDYVGSSGLYQTLTEVYN